ncbi:hypothetical protein D3C72_2451530 [compost metagenome]
MISWKHICRVRRLTPTTSQSEAMVTGSRVFSSTYSLALSTTRLCSRARWLLPGRSAPEQVANRLSSIDWRRPLRTSG